MGSVVQAALVGMRGQLRGGKLVLPEEDGLLAILHTALFGPCTKMCHSLICRIDWQFIAQDMHIRASGTRTRSCCLENNCIGPTLIALVTRLRRPAGAVMRGAERGWRSGLAAAWRAGTTGAAAAGRKWEMM